jgi:hypothetical protein
LKCKVSAVRPWPLPAVYPGKEGRDVTMTMTNQCKTPAPVAAGGCCGGPAPAGADACCVKDADVKAAGGDGCGCTTAPAAPAATPAGKTGCCG